MKQFLNLAQWACLIHCIALPMIATVATITLPPWLEALEAPLLAISAANGLWCATRPHTSKAAKILLAAASNMLVGALLIEVPEWTHAGLLFAIIMGLSLPHHHHTCPAPHHNER